MRTKIKKEKFLERLGRYTKEGGGYLKESRSYVYGVAILFFANILVGFFFAEYFSFYSSIIMQMIERTKGLGDAELGIFIFFSNFRTAFFSLFLGVFGGIFSLFNIFFNGILIGYVLKTLWVESGAIYFWMLIPHGVFELPALFISWGLGIKLGMFIFSKNEAKELMRRFEESLKTFFFIVVPLLIIAAIIEGIFIAYFS